MSSIKRDVKKKTPPRPEGEIFSRDPAHCSFATVEKFGWLSILVGFLMVAMPSSSKERQARLLFKVNHGSIRGSWPMAISGYPRGHNVKWVTRCPSTRGRISLTDTPLEPSISRTRPTTTGEISQRWKALLHRRCSSCLSRQVLWIETHSFLPHR
jgi:hypothetical protein